MIPAYIQTPLRALAIALGYFLLGELGRWRSHPVRQAWFSLLRVWR